MTGPVVHGLLLAAGAGRRMGGPKALLRDRDGVPFLGRALTALVDGGCDTVTVVLGASAADARAVLDETGWGGHPAVDVVVAEGWDEGMGASLRAGLDAVAHRDADAVLVGLVDLPDVGASVVRRFAERIGDGSRVLLRATYDGEPGHPVLIGREHWAGVARAARGDRGARDYLGTHGAVPVECSDLATGRDVDRPRDL